MTAGQPSDLSWFVIERRVHPRSPCVSFGGRLIGEDGVGKGASVQVIRVSLDRLSFHLFKSVDNLTQHSPCLLPALLIESEDPIAGDAILALVKGAFLES